MFIMWKLLENNFFVRLNIFKYFNVESKVFVWCFCVWVYIYVNIIWGIFVNGYF